MISLFRRLLELVVVSFALYAFVTVPLGSRTGLEHARLVFGTKEAKEAGAEIGSAGKRMLSELIEFRSPPYRGTPEVPQLRTSISPETMED